MRDPSREGGVVFSTGSIFVLVVLVMRDDRLQTSGTGRGGGERGEREREREREREVHRLHFKHTGSANDNCWASFQNKTE